MKRSYKLPTELEKQNDPLSRERLIQALAVSIMLDEAAGIEIAGCDPALFVQVVQPIVGKLSDKFHYTFTSADLRQVHWHLRRHVAELARRKGLPVLDMEHGRIPGLRVVH